MAGIMSVPEWRRFARARLNSASRYLSRAYIAGPELQDALGAFDRFAGVGQAGTIGYFNPAMQAPAAIARINQQLFVALADGRQRGYVSLKVPAMGFDIGLLDALARQSALSGVGMHFDSHAIETTDPTFACIAAALRHTGQVGCTLPGRWPRSLQDAEQAIALKLRVRVVKGQWADPATPDLDPAAGFMRVVDQLAGKAQSVAVATHHPDLARAALRRLLDAGTPCELEQLFGLPMRTVSGLARQMGVPVRVYIPFGTAWLPYALTQLIKKPGMLWWLLKDAAAVGIPRV
jgi:proline dehydrogenase